MLSGPKDWSFTPPENLQGDGLSTPPWEKTGDSSLSGKTENWAQIYPENEKTTGGLSKIVGIKELAQIDEVRLKHTQNLKKKSFSEKNHNTGVWILSFAEKVKKNQLKQQVVDY